MRPEVREIFSSTGNVLTNNVVVGKGERYFFIVLCLIPSSQIWRIQESLQVFSVLCLLGRYCLDDKEGHEEM